MAKLVDALDLGSSPFGGAGSIPARGTIASLAEWLDTGLQNRVRWFESSMVLKIKKNLMEIITIKRKGKDLRVTPVQVKDLDKTKCSPKFLKHIGDDLTEDSMVYVKCLSSGELDLTTKKKEYRILLELK